MIALGLFVQLRLPATPKACAGDMLVRRDRRCGALCGASAASVNAPFFLFRTEAPVCQFLPPRILCTRIVCGPAKLWLAVQRFAPAQRFNVVS